MVKLSKTFVLLHRPEFVSGVQRVIELDPTLGSLFVKGKFPRFEIQELDPYIQALEKYEKNPLEGQSLLSKYFFKSICDSLISQQISGAAAISIKKKILRLFDESGEKYPDPKWFLQQPDDRLRVLGLSNRKVEYVKCLSKEFVEKEAELIDTLLHEDNSVVIERLILLKGIGEWTAKLFLVFGLRRLNVFADGDLGVARGVARYFEARKELLKEIEKEVILNPKIKSKWVKTSKRKRNWTPVHEQYMIAISERFAPYQLIFMLAMWELSSTNIEAVSSSV